MSKHKHIIKNCPCFVEGIAIKGNEQKTQTCNNHKVRELTLCQDCTDCVLKQIVELCNKIIFLNGGTDFTDVDMYKHAIGENFVAKKILQLLDIQEVE